jgi:uncharacterized protein YjbI with pentapeptide repeats
MKRMFLTCAVYTLAIGLCACGDTDSAKQDVPAFSVGNFFNEHELTEESVLGAHQNVLLHLESDGESENDSGSEGIDRVRYVWPTRSEHTFCLDDNEGFGHSARLYDRDENLMMEIKEDDECTTITIEAGIYWLEVENGRKGEENQSDFIFIHPDSQVPVPEPASEDPSSRLHARSMDACHDTETGNCAMVKVGSMESWASDYVGQPVEGQVMIYGDDSSQFQTSGAPTTLNQSGPSHRAVLLNGRCDYLGTTGIGFDDSLVGIIVGPNTGAWLYHDNLLGGANNFYYENKTFYNDILLPAKTVSSMWVMTIAKNNTFSLINSKSCIQCDLHNVNLSNLDLTGAVLTGANLNSSLFQKAILTNADLSSCDLRKTRFTAALLNGVNMQGSRLNGANFSQTSLRGANISHAYLNRDDINGYTAAVFSNAYMANVDLSFSDCTRAVFSNSHFFSDNGTATAEKANLSGAMFDGTVLYGTNFNQVTLNGTIFSNANLVNATFDNIAQDPNSVFGFASFNGALLAGTSFSNSTLPTTDLSNAQISTQNHSLKFNVMINIKQLEGRTYTATTTVKPTVSGSSTCPDRFSAPCDCSLYSETSGCTVEGRWTPAIPPEIIGDNDPDEW